MECTRERSDSPHQTIYEIHLSLVGTRVSWYERLRFLLLGSKWLPKVPLGMLVWSALHVLLVVAGAPAMLFYSATMIVGVLYFDSLLCLMVGVFFLVGVPCCLIYLLMRLSWALVLCNGERDPQMRVAWEGFGKCWNYWSNVGGGLPPPLLTRALVMNLGDTRKQMFGGWRVVGRWCEEAVHLHDSFVVT